MAENTLSPDFDAAPLADIEAGLPRAEFRSFIEEYLVSTAARVKNAQALDAAGDLVELRAEAHALISTSGSFGLHRAADLARKLEESCKAGQGTEARQLVTELAASSQRGWAAMRARFLA